MNRKERKRKLKMQEENRRRKEKERLEDEERGKKRAKLFISDPEDPIEPETVNDKVDKPFATHIRSKPSHVQLAIPVKEFRAETSKIGNHRNLSDRGQSDILSSMVLHGGGELKDFPCSTSTMRK